MKQAIKDSESEDTVSDRQDKFEKVMLHINKKIFKK